MKFAIEIENITAAGRHAATQVLLRHNYLKFGGFLEELDHYGGSSLSASDFDLGEEIRSAIDEITIERTTPGAKPHKKISDDRFYEAELPKGWKMVHHGISKLQSVSFQVHSLLYSRSHSVAQRYTIWKQSTIFSLQITSHLVRMGRKQNLTIIGGAGKMRPLPFKKECNEKLNLQKNTRASWKELPQVKEMMTVHSPFVD